MLPQQSLSTRQLACAVAHPQVPLTHGLLPQQSLSNVQLAPWSAQSDAHVFDVGSQRSVPQQSESEEQLSPWLWHAQVPSEPQRSEPQQSELALHELPACWQAQVPSEPQRRTPQQSLLDPQVEPAKAQPQVPLTHKAEQQSSALLQASPSSVHAPASGDVGSAHVNDVWSQRRAPQQSSSLRQSPAVPAHAGAQVPKSQKIEQQSPSVLQLLPSSTQRPPESAEASCVGTGWPASLPTPPPPVVLLAHLPAVQSCEQHCAKPEHDAPFCWHATPPSMDGGGAAASREGGGAPHAPSVHLLLQQSLAAVQLTPSDLQAAEPHVPDTQSWLQQSVLCMQAEAWGAQVGAAQAPPVHVPVQHWLDVVHAAPEAEHAGAAQAPDVHVLLQQSLACAQPWPVERQRAPVHTPAEHESLQQSVYAMHVAPAARHFPAGTGVLLPSMLASRGGSVVMPVSNGDAESPPVIIMVPVSMPFMGVELSARGLSVWGLLLPQPAAVTTPIAASISGARTKLENFMSHPVRKSLSGSAIVGQGRRAWQESDGRMGQKGRGMGAVGPSWTTKGASSGRSVLDEAR